MNFEQLLNQYDYPVSPELIAQEPASPRDGAKLLVYNRKSGETKFDTFKNIGKYLPKGSVLVFNQTKVVPARLQVRKETGGKAEILYISHDKNSIRAIADRKLRIASTMTLFRGSENVSLEVVGQENQFYLLKPSFPISKIHQILEKYGQTPLPPYIKHSKLTEKQRRKEYQAVFAKQGMSVAAPTASLHFTKQLIGNLKKQGIAVKFVTLHVGMGTFAPLKEENIQNGQLHTEEYGIDSKTATFLNKVKKEGRPIVAVGTTVVRTLESAVQGHGLIKLQSSTNIFIREDTPINFVDCLITNFHVPKSSLLMLVSSFVGRKKLLALYEKAQEKKFRFFSFGDGMLVI